MFLFVIAVLCPLYYKCCISNKRFAVPTVVFGKVGNIIHILQTGNVHHQKPRFALHIFVYSTTQLTRLHSNNMTALRTFQCRRFVEQDIEVIRLCTNLDAEMFCYYDMYYIHYY